MTFVRLIPCLDVDSGRVVKGVRFRELADRGDPAELAARYAEEGADEIVFLDITASTEDRETLIDAVTRTAEKLFIPLTVGGGVRSVEDASRLLRAGADKIAVNTSAVKRPELITELATTFGSQCVVASIDAARVGPDWEVFTHGGREGTGIQVREWALQCVQRGAGEILLTSIDRDGSRRGYDLELLAAIAAIVSVPIVASGGVGSAHHLVEGARAGATGLLLAGILHDGTHSVKGLRQELGAGGVSLRELASVDNPRGGLASEGGPGHPESTWPAEVAPRGSLRLKTRQDLDRLHFSPLIPVVAQDHVSGEVLMMAYASRPSLELTLETGFMHYYSRSRKEIWLKGATSGNRQRCLALFSDCDSDAVLVLIEPEGPACHTGARSCFGEGSEPDLTAMLRAIETRKRASRATTDPAPEVESQLSYTQRLLQNPNLRIKKIGEETAEVIQALLTGDESDAAAEAADLIYHLAVALEAKGSSLGRAVAELGKRNGRRLPEAL